MEQDGVYTSKKADETGAGEREKVAKVEELQDKALLSAVRMQRIGERLGDEIARKDKHAIETHKEYMKEVEKWGAIIKEIVEFE